MDTEALLQTISLSINIDVHNWPENFKAQVEKIFQSKSIQREMETRGETRPLGADIRPDVKLHQI